MKQITCPQCNIIFNEKYQNNKFCSRSCAGIYNNAHPTAKILTNRRKKTKKCNMCDTLIFANTKFCAVCLPKRTMQEDITLGEIREKYAYQIHSKVRSMSRAKYQNSNKPKHCIYCNYSIYYEVCHIKAIKDYASTSTLAEVNHLDNLIALCPNHHWELDNKKLTIEKIIARGLE